MSKAFIELKSRSRRYKLNADDIGRLFKISKRRSPGIPDFNQKMNNIV